MENLYLYMVLATGLITALTFRTPVKGKTKLPPGPKPLPIIGNVLDFPPQGVPEFQHWLKHKDLYGPISSVSAMGAIIVFVHDQTIASSLLEKKAAKTSQRPELCFVNELCGFDMFLGSNKDAETTIRRHKILVRHMGDKARVQQLSSAVEAEVDRLLLKLLKEPTGLTKHLRIEAGATILKMVYDYSIEREGVDPLIAMIERMMANFSAAIVPLAWIVDIVPALRHLPEWLPGMSFKTTARAWRKLNEDVCAIPYSFALNKVASGRSHQSSYISTATEEEGMPSSDGSISQQDDDIKYSAASMYAAGSDTSVSTLTSFFLAMMKYPEVQRKAHAEIDAVIGSDRLPGYGDRQNLPFINALVQETHRWNPALPMGIPHRTDQEIEIEGYTLPKETAILPATWWFCHDPETYTEPDLFDPARYLEPRNEVDPKTFVFGYGRRRCPGNMIADWVMFLNIARILAVFNIEKITGQRDEDVKIENTPGAITHLKPFDCLIKPRSRRHEELIPVAVDQDAEESDAGSLAI